MKPKNPVLHTLLPKLTAIGLLSMVTTSTALAAENAAQSPTNQELAQQAKVRIKTFASTLQGELKAAIKSGGLPAGIKVCNERAPQIAADLSTDGWVVARTSLKTRNASNQPDAWEQSMLMSFESRKQGGEPVSELAAVERSDEQFRLMKAIPTGQVCLACHGVNISQPVKDTLAQYYPHDMATGFSVGDIRGAFTVSKRLN